MTFSLPLLHFKASHVFYVRLRVPFLYNSNSPPASPSPCPLSSMANFSTFAATSHSLVLNTIHVGAPSLPRVSCRLASSLSWSRRDYHDPKLFVDVLVLRRNRQGNQRASEPCRRHKAPCFRAVFTEKQEGLVKSSWAILRKDAGRHAMALFMKVFDIAPSAKKLFSFLKDSNVPLEQNPKLKSHALKVFVIICEAASSLTKKGEVSTPGSTMKDMAEAHYVSGVLDEHYEVVKHCMLKTLEEGLPGEMWNDEMKEAWSEAYDELVKTIRSTEIAAPEK